MLVLTGTTVISLVFRYLFSFVDMGTGAFLNWGDSEFGGWGLVDPRKV